MNRRRSKLSFVLSAFLILVSQATGQDSPDVNAIVRNVVETHAHLEEFEVAVRQKIQSVGQSGETNSYSSNYKMAIRRPNQFRYETGGPNSLLGGLVSEASSGSLLLIGNENDVVMFAPALNRYGHLTAKAPETTAFYGSGEHWVTRFVDLLGGKILRATLAGEEKLEREGGLMDCWILDAFDGGLGFPVKVWIDKITYLIAKEQMESRFYRPNSPAEETGVSEFTYSQINVHIPDDVFVFTPPADAKNEDFVLKLDGSR